MTATRSYAARAVHTATRDDPRPDPELLARFVTHHDTAAFAAVVARHGPLVYGVCRRTLGATPDADDAFQAAFLVLAQRAGSTPWRGGLGPWLFGVAHRIARKTRFKRDRRFAVEKQVDAMPHPETTPPDLVESDELSRAFDEELAALPEDMRRAVVLCELQGRSRQQAARELRIGEGTLSSRLARARKLLRDRLAKRGFGLVIPAAAVTPAKLTAATVGLVNGSAGVVPAAVAALTQEAVKAMTISKLKLGAVLAAVAVGVSGFGLAVGGDDIKPPVKADPQVKPAKEKEKGFELELSLTIGSGAVATIHGQDVSRAEFAEYLIRKHGAKEIELFVNQKIILAEAKRRGVTVTDTEVEAKLRQTINALAVSQQEFETVTLQKSGYTLATYRENVVIPLLTIDKLLADEVKVTDADLRVEFEGKYGEKRKVQFIFWERGTDPEMVAKQAAEAKRDGEAFDRIAAGQAHRELAATKGHLGPIGRTDRMERGGVLTDVAFELKAAGDVSEVIRLEEGVFALVKLVEVVPPEAGRRFEDEKAKLAEMARWRVQQELTPKRVAEWKERAKPVYHIQPEPKTYSVPVPQKK
ncbi:MAG: sigma-70 family RNA polymerase sigma factor [Gemmataceae bacterium]